MKYKILLLLGVLIFLPLINGVDSPQEPFDMVYLLVENVFGGLLLTALGLIVIFICLGMLAKMQPMTLIFFCLLFLTAFAIGLIGGIAALIAGILSMGYFFYGLLRALKIITPE